MFRKLEDEGINGFYVESEQEFLAEIKSLDINRWLASRTHEFPHHGTNFHKLARCLSNDAMIAILNKTDFKTAFNLANLNNKLYISHHHTYIVLNREVPLDNWCLGKFVHTKLMARIGKTAYEKILDGSIPAAPITYFASYNLKQLVLDHIVSLPRPEQVAALTNVLKPDHQLYNFYNTQRGISKPDQSKGYFKTIKETLAPQKSAPRSFLDYFFKPKPVTTHEPEATELAVFKRHAV